MRIWTAGIYCLLFVLYSCADKKEDWLQKYAQTKCAYQNEEDKINADSIAKISSLIAEMEKLQKQLTFITSPCDKRIKELNEEIQNAQKDYMKAYRIAEGKQSEKYGHRNTPAYEKEINKLDLIKRNKISSLQNRIAEVKSEMESKDEYKSITEKIKLKEDKIKTTKDLITTTHKPVIDSLQELLDLENSNFKRLKSEFEPTEQKNFELKRDSIRANPCK